MSDGLGCVWRFLDSVKTHAIRNLENSGNKFYTLVAKKYLPSGMPNRVGCRTGDIVLAALKIKIWTPSYSKTFFFLYGWEGRVYSTHPISAYIFLLSPTLWLPTLWFILLEFPVGICDVLHITTHEYDCDLITGFPFALVFTCTLKALLKITKYQEFWKTSGYSLKWV